MQDNLGKELGTGVTLFLGKKNPEVKCLSRLAKSQKTTLPQDQKP